MKILIYRWSVFHQEDIAEAFESFGHTVEYYEEMPDERKGTDIRRLKEVVAEYDLVFSANYFSRVSNACQAQQKKYIAWTVDSPMLTMFDTSVFNECNYIFLFDKFDYYRFLQMGVKHVYYLPLAVNAERVKNCIETASEKEKGKYRGIFPLSVVCIIKIHTMPLKINCRSIYRVILMHAWKPSWIYTGIMCLTAC